METALITEFHKNLANYFASKPLYQDEPTQKKPNARKLVELPWQQTKAEMWNEVTNTLCNLDFIQAKSAAKMTYELVNDFNSVLDVIPDNAETIRQEMERQARMDKYTHDLIFCAKGEITADELEIPESITPWTEEQIDAEIERIKTNPTRADKLKDFSHFLGREAGNIQEYAFEFAHFTTQQAWNYSDSGTVGYSVLKQMPNFRKESLLLNQKNRPKWNPLPQVIKVLKGHKESITSVAITPDGTKAISGSKDNSCILWDLSTGNPIYSLIGHNSHIKKISITPDAKYAISTTQSQAGDTNTCILWDLSCGKISRTLDAGPSPSGAITPDGQKALTGSYRNCILWDLKTGKVLKKIEYSFSNIQDLDITPEATKAIIGEINEIYLLDLTDGGVIKLIKGHSDHIQSVKITPDGKLGLTGSRDSIILWDLTKGSIISKMQKYTDAVSITPNGKYAVSSSCYWDLTQVMLLRNLYGHSEGFNAIEISPDGRFAFSGSGDKTCIFWDLITGLPEVQVEGRSNTLPAMDLHPIANIVASGYSNSIKVWDLTTGEIIQTLNGHRGEVYSVAITPDYKRLFSAGADDNLVCILWNLNTGKIDKTFKGHTAATHAVAITPDGKYAISGASRCSRFSSSLDNSLIFWNLLDGTIIHIFPETGHEITSITITPDGKRAISGHRNGYCSLWDLISGSLVTLRYIHSDAIPSLNIAPNGKKVISASWDNTCKYWNINDEREDILTGHIDAVNAVSISPDGGRAFSSSRDKTCILWNLETGKMTLKYFPKSVVISAKYYSRGIIIGERSGQVFELNGSRELLFPEICIVTIKQIWNFELNKYTQPYADCPLCNNRFEPPLKFIQTIIQILKGAGITPEHSPCLELPDEAWEHPGLLGECPECNEKLKFNPFFGSDQKEIEDYIAVNSLKIKFQEIFDSAEKALKEEQWQIAYNLYFKLVQQGQFDKNKLRYKMAICKINSLTYINQQIINDIDILVVLLRGDGAIDSAKEISQKLKDRLESIKGNRLQGKKRCPGGRRLLIK